SAKPDFAAAYNALGYSFAERGIRLDEAYQLIQMAQNLMPGDPYIQDSLGWVQFRLGRLDEALVTLKIAYAARSDPEIAAHLGEIMWNVGKHSEAMVIWQKALKDFPGNAVLIAVMGRLAH
ncbi:MAG: tetratricopeptide repeat protein, partial [Pseudomonadota bacterium]